MQQITVAIRYRINVSSFLLADLYNTTALTGRLQIVPFNGEIYKFIARRREKSWEIGRARFIRTSRHSVIWFY